VLLLRDGQVEQRALDEKLASRGVLLMSLSEAVVQQPELVRRYLGTTDNRAQQSKLTWLARALWADGAFLYVPRGVVVDEPFQILHWTTQASPAFYWTLVVADEAATATVIDSYASSEELPETLASGLVDVVAKQAARLSYLHLQERDERCWSFTNMRAEQARDSAISWLTLELGARLSRNELTCSLEGQGAEADVIGMVFGEGSQFFDLQSVQDHVGSDTRSDLLHKVALRDRSRSNFTGLIRVGAEALRTASNQVSRNLLLDDGARADSDPNLEILNSDVTRCGHGAAVGPVDEEMIYYLMTRGLSQEQAERLIVEGFFAPLLEQIPLESVRERLRAAIYRKLER
jgi:Fe-S cluster assembly protein SufD